MSKNMIIGISAGAAAIILAIIIFFGISVGGKTDGAKAASNEFTALLQSGDLEQLSMAYNMYSDKEASVYRDETGVVKSQTLTNQQFAELYGPDALKITEDDTAGASGAADASGVASAEQSYMQEAHSDAITKEMFFDMVIDHSQMASKVGTVWGDETEMTLEMMIPDLKTWMLNLTDEQMRELNAIEDNEAFLQEVGARIDSGEITSQYHRFRLPMYEENGRWRVQMTEELEQALYCGLDKIFETTETETGAGSAQTPAG